MEKVTIYKSVQLALILASFTLSFFLPNWARAQTVGDWYNVAQTCDLSAGYVSQFDAGLRQPYETGVDYVSCGIIQFSLSGSCTGVTEIIGLPLSDLVVGQEYNFELAYANFANRGSGYWNVSTAGSLLGSTDTIGASGNWATKDFSFTASSTSQVLTLAPGAGSSCGSSYMTASVGFNVAPDNEAPTVMGVAESRLVTEDTSSNLDLSETAFSDAEGDDLTVTFEASSGALTASSSGGVTIGGSGTSSLTLLGSAANINTYLDTVSNIQYTTASDASGIDVATLTVSASDGTAGLASNPTVQINAVGLPDVTSVTASTTDGHYKAGETVSVQVTFDEAVTTTTGGATLTIDVGGAGLALPVSAATNSTTLTFEYTVRADDNSADLDYISTTALALAGGTIQGASGAADLTLPTPGASGSLGANKSIVIDTTAPVVTDTGISLSTGSGTNDAFKVGDTVTASWQTSGGDGDTNITSTLGGVTVDFSAFGGANNVAATLSGTTWTATYTIMANTSTSGSNLNVSVTATDEAGNSTTAADTSDATVDANPPVVSASNISLSGATGTGGVFRIGDTVTATWDDTAAGDNNDDVASASVDFTEFGGGSAVVASNSSGTWTATYTITNGSIDLNNRNVSVTATDTAGNDTTTQDDENATVDNVPPTVTAANIIVSGATGNPNNSVFKIGDTVTVEWDDTGAGDNNADTIDGVTVDFSDFGASAPVAATNSAGVWTATYEYTAGTIAGSNYGVSITVTDNAGNITSEDDDEQLSLDNVQTSEPAGIALEDDDNSGSTADTITSETKPTINGTAEANATIDVYVDGILVGQTTADGTGAWSYTFTNLAEGDNAITTTATDAVGNTSDPSAPLSITIDITPPAQPPAPALDPAGNTGSLSDLITSDTTPPVSGTAEPNSTVEIFVDGVSVGAVTADSNGDWSFTLPEGSLTEGDNAITLTSTDVAGNTSTASNALTITLDTTAPSIAITDPLMGDNLFNAAEATAVTLSGTTTDVDNGQTVTLSVSDGTTTLPFTTAVSSNTWTTTVDLSSLSDGQLTITADVTDVAGNAATQASHTIAKDIDYPSVEVKGPTEIVTSAFDVTISFSEPVFGFELADVTVAEGTGAATNITGSGDAYTVTIDPVLGKTVQVSVAAGVTADEAGNPNLQSNIFEVQAGSPASEFEKYREEIRQVLVDEAARSLTTTLSTNRRMVQSARERFVVGQSERAACSEDDTGAGNEATCDVGLVSRNNVPFDVDGGFELSGSTLSTNGSFFEQTGNYEGTQRRLFFGDFDVQHDADTDSTTATITARVAWEQMYGDKTMLGYFIGGELAHSNIDGTFEGDQDRLGLAFGGYAVHQLDEQVFLDGFITLGAGRNDLEMANDVLALTSDHTTRTATVGAALSGVYEYERYEFRPELAFSYGKTWIGDVGFTGVAYGLTDNMLSLDAGNVSITNLTLRPEVVWALDADTVADSRTQLTYAPRLICERVQSTTTTQDCGTGGEIGLTSTSRDGMSNAEFRVIVDKVGDSTRSSLMLNFERQF